jgi:hypothetical protein
VATNGVFDTSQSFTVQSCQNITLQAGDNFIRTAKGLNTGIDLDQLVLTTDTFANTSTFTPVTVNSHTRTQLTARIETSTPQIISFGQSINRGWKASLRTPEGTLDLGPPFVVQGYANGWLVPQSGDLILKWTPQRFVWGSIVFSILCITGLIVLALRRPRRRVATDQGVATSPKVSLTLPAMIVTTLLVLAFAGILPVLGAGVLLLAPRRYNAVAVAILVATITGVIVVQQTRFGYPPTLDWPLRFAGLTALTWTAVAVACINPLLRRH